MSSPESRPLSSHGAIVREAPASSASPTAPDESASTTRIIVDRPPEGPARGTLPVDAWVIVVVTAAAVVVGAALWVWRYRRMKGRLQ